MGEAEGTHGLKVKPFLQIQGVKSLSNRQTSLVLSITLVKMVFFRLVFRTNCNCKLPPTNSCRCSSSEFIVKLPSNISVRLVFLCCSAFLSFSFYISRHISLSFLSLSPSLSFLSLTFSLLSLFISSSFPLFLSFSFLSRFVISRNYILSFSFPKTCPPSSFFLFGFIISSFCFSIGNIET